MRYTGMGWGGWTSDVLVREHAGELSYDGSAEPSSAEDEADTLLRLSDRIATLAAHQAAADYEMLTLIAEFDRLGGWKAGDFRSCAHWLAFLISCDLGTARQKVRVARALCDLPATGEAMAHGELSFSKVRAITRVASPQNEAEWVELGRTTTAAELEKVVRSYRTHGLEDEQELERARHASRYLSIVPSDDGMYLVRGRLDAEVGALLMRTIEAAGDALFVQERRDESPELRESAAEHGLRPPVDQTTPRQRRADAVGLLAERAMAAGFGPGRVRPDCRKVGGDSDGPHPDDPTPISGTRAERYQVVLHVDPDTLTAQEHGGRSHLEDGTRVSAETSRRLCCDAGVVRMTDSDGEILDVGRKTRTIPPPIRRALHARDGGCQFPGCGLRFTDAHHLLHWALGGETCLTNLILVCRRHHRALHEGGFRVEREPDGRFTFYDPRGIPLPTFPPAIKLDRPGALELVERHHDCGIEPDWSTLSLAWKTRPAWDELAYRLDRIDRLDQIE